MKLDSTKTSPDFSEIDNILKVISEQAEPPKLTDSQISEKFDEINSKRLFEILYKLTRDRYIRKEINTDNHNEYFSTYEGSILSQSGGYKQLFEDKLIESKANRYKENMVLIISTIMVVTSIVSIVIGISNYNYAKESNIEKQEILNLKSQVEVLESKNTILINKLKYNSETSELYIQK